MSSASAGLLGRNHERSDAQPADPTLQAARHLAKRANTVMVSQSMPQLLRWMVWLNLLNGVLLLITGLDGFFVVDLQIMIICGYEAFFGAWIIAFEMKVFHGFLRTHFNIMFTYMARVLFTFILGNLAWPCGSFGVFTGLFTNLHILFMLWIFYYHPEFASNNFNVFDDPYSVQQHMSQLEFVGAAHTNSSYGISEGRDLLGEWLEEVQITEYAEQFFELGIRNVRDLLHLEDEDITALVTKMRKYDGRRFMKFWTLLHEIDIAQAPKSFLDL